MFKILHTNGQARAGEITTKSGVIQTPAFLPCATYGNLRSVGQEFLADEGRKILLANAYHLYLRPGVEVIKKMGGIHKFMNWQGSVFTDSGGFQAFALSKFAKFFEEGIEFRSHYDGSKHFFTPELVVKIQEDLDVDIATCLDVCTGFPASEQEVRRAVEQTNRWANRSIAARKNKKMLLYGMVQGSIYKDLRKLSAEHLASLPFDGFAIGGNMYTFGETVKELEQEKPKMWETVSYTNSILPQDKPRHLLGVGEPSDIINGVAAGVDHFDCVMASRIARHGAGWVRKSKDGWDYERLNFKAGSLKDSNEPISHLCDCVACTGGYTRGFIRHLLTLGDPFAGTLLTMHNLHFLFNLVDDIRQSILDDNFEEKFLTRSHRVLER